ncbi:MAG: NAD-dependent succinate-semialdehyde dehydrogenase [Anaerolineae bacterium]|nr:NAD-dependent succinate-semialdehyde dehydrogenase [Anaerolineae bacterium]
MTDTTLDFVPAAVRALMTHSHSGRTFAVTSPATGQVFAHAADCAADEAHAAADLAAATFVTWRSTTAFERAAILRRWFNLMLEHVQPIARLMSLEMGKPITEAVGEVRYAAGFIEWFAEEAKRVYGETVPGHLPNKRLFVIKQPVGPVFAVTPWNFPAAMVTRKAAPALAAGCTFILKPAEQSPLTAYYLAYLWQQAGGPAGAFQVLTAQDPVPVAQTLMQDERIRKITFTGSTEVGKLLYAQSAATMKRISLELGGHAPFLIFEDADIDLAVQEVLLSKFRNAGQTCVCANRIYVHTSLQDEFARRLAEAVQTLRLGDPLDENTRVGPLIDLQGLHKVQAHVADAIAGGAKVLVGGQVAQGLFFQPTVIVGIKPTMRVMTEETFGPVAPLLSFETEAEAIRLANETPYGLAAYLYTNDLNRAIRVAEALDYGIIGLNDGLPSTPQVPFGGFKNSGIGREGGKWGLEEYLEVKYISLALH